MRWEREEQPPTIGMHRHASKAMQYILDAITRQTSFARASAAKGVCGLPEEPKPVPVEEANR